MGNQEEESSSLPSSNPNTLAISRAFFDFVPLPSGAPVVNLPIVDDGVYQFNLTINAAGEEVFIDPLVAIGYLRNRSRQSQFRVEVPVAQCR